MLSQELVDEWFMSGDIHIARTELRNRAKMAIIDRITGNVLDKNDPDDFLPKKKIKNKHFISPL